MERAIYMNIRIWSNIHLERMDIHPKVHLPSIADSGEPDRSNAQFSLETYKLELGEMSKKQAKGSQKKARVREIKDSTYLQGEDASMNTVKKFDLPVYTYHPDARRLVEGDCRIGWFDPMEQILWPAEENRVFWKGTAVDYNTNAEPTDASIPQGENIIKPNEEMVEHINNNRERFQFASV